MSWTPLIFAISLADRSMIPWSSERWRMRRQPVQLLLQLPAREDARAFDRMLDKLAQKPADAPAETVDDEHDLDRSIDIAQIEDGFGHIDQ